MDPFIDEPIQDMVAFIDFKGDEWQLVPIGIEYDIRRCVHCIDWLVVYGPASLTTPPYNYQVLDTEVFTEWWSC